MKQFKLYEAEPGENISALINDVLALSKTFDKLCYIKFNDVVFHVSPDDTEEVVFSRYDQLRADRALAEDAKNSNLISVEELSNKIAKFITNL